jgi:hypothetical protein
VEQKDYTHVRLLVGDDRFDHEDFVEPLNEELTLWSPWNNLYSSQRRLVSKQKDASGKVKRVQKKRLKLLHKAAVEDGHDW